MLVAHQAYLPVPEESYGGLSMRIKRPVRSAARSTAVLTQAGATAIHVIIDVFSLGMLRVLRISRKISVSVLASLAYVSFPATNFINVFGAAHRAHL